MDNAAAFWRFWQMLRFVPRAPAKVSTAELRDKLAAAGVHVDVRSIQRDLLKLSVYFPIIHDDNKPRGWSFSGKTTLLDVPGLDAHTAIAFQLVEKYLRHQLPRVTLNALEPHFRTARELLKSLKRRGLPSWTERVHVQPRSQPLLPPRVSDDVLAQVYEALLQERSLKLRYGRRQDGQVTEAEVHPQGLLFRGTVAYLACTFWAYDDVRLLALHRIASAELQETPRRAKAGFSLEEFAASGSAEWRVDDEPIELVLRLTKEAAVTLQETPLGKDQTEETLPDESVRVRVRVNETRVLHAWLRSFGAALEVEAPAPLRERMAADARDLAARYAAGDRNLPHG